MIMNRTRTIIIFVFIVILLLSLWVALSKKPKQQQGLPPQLFVTPAPIRPSALPQSISNSPIAYSGELLFTAPKTVPYYSVNRRRDFEAERERLFAFYNITTPPTTIIGARGRYASFVQGGKSGTISENPLTFVVRTAATSNKTVTNDVNTYLSTVTGVLTELSLLPSLFIPTITSERYFKFDESHPTDSKSSEGALVVRLDFTASIEGAPLFIGDADTPVFSASFNGDNVLVELRSSILPDITREKNSVEIISYEEALHRLTSNTGVFSSVSLTNAGDKEFMTGALPDNIKIEKVTLGYYYSNIQDYLIPVFVFSGSAQEPGESAVLHTTTVVSAL